MFNHTAPLPFNAEARPGLGMAVSSRYREYCESPEAPQDRGPNAIRQAKYAEIHAELLPKFPTYREIGG